MSKIFATKLLIKPSKYQNKNLTLNFTIRL